MNATAVVVTMVDARSAERGAGENNMEFDAMQSLLMVFLLAQETVPSSMQVLGAHLIAAVVFSLVGIVVFFLSLLVMEKLTPFSIIKEITEEHNQAMATIIGAIVVGISIIIAAATLG